MCNYKFRLATSTSLSRSIQENAATILKSRNEIIKQIKIQLTENHTQLLEKTALIDALKSERESAVFNFNNIKDSLSSSIILVDKDNIITTLNEKAEKLFGIDSFEASLGLYTLQF